VLRISDTHWQAFEEAQLRRFVTAQMDRLRTTYPDAVANRFDNDPSLFEQVICNSIDEAEKFGIIGEDDVAFYLDCLFEIGFDFSKKREWGSEILSRRDINGTTKMDLIWERLHPEIHKGQPE
jgi:hypothetical protein